MTDSYVGQIMPWPSEKIPVGWALCMGQLMDVSAHAVLYHVIGRTYGGHGSTFALPNLCERTIVGADNEAYRLGHEGGSDSVTLETKHIPRHTHAINAHEGQGTNHTPENGMPAKGTGPRYAEIKTSKSKQLMYTTTYGNGQPVDNCQASIVLNFIICVDGLMPSYDAG